MNGLHMLFALFLLANLLAVLLRVMRGPTAADRMLAALMSSSIGIAMLLLLAQAANEPALVDGALLFALLVAISGVAFAQRAWYHAGDNENDRA